MMRRIMLSVILVVCAFLYAPVVWPQSAKTAGELLIITSYPYEGRYEYRYISSLVNAYQDAGGACTPVVEILGVQSLDGRYEWLSRFKSLLAKHPNPAFIVLVGAEAWSCYFSLTESKYRKIPVACFMGQRYGPTLSDHSIPSVQVDSLHPQGVVDYLELMKPFNVKWYHYYDYDIESDYRLIQHFFPGTKEIALISDNTFVGLGEMRIVEHTLRNRYPDIKIHYIDGSRMSMDEALQATSALPKGTAAILCIWRYDIQNVIYMNNADYLFREANPHLPVFSLTSTGIGYWCIGGSTPVYDDYEGAKLATFIYRYVDKGNRMQPVDFYCLGNQYVFDDQQLKAFNINRRLIPSKSVLVNLEEGWSQFFQEYKWYVLLILLLVALLTLGFVASARYSLRIRSLLKRVEQDKLSLQRSERELRIAKDRAEESNRLKTAFIQNMSHEIRTPLNAIVGFSTILEDETKENQDLKEYVRIISHNSDLLLKLINDVIDLSRLDSGRQYFKFERQDVLCVCQQTIASLKSSANPFVELRFVHTTPTIMAETDVIRLQQVLVNLVGNALKFTKLGFVELKVEPNDPAGEWLFSITDSGCGIPVEKQQTVFERFIKLDDYTQGTGLGLPICQISVDKLGGRIWIDPHYTEGSRFMFTIPYVHKQIDEEVICD